MADIRIGSPGRSTYGPGASQEGASGTYGGDEVKLVSTPTSAAAAGLAKSKRRKLLGLGVPNAGAAHKSLEARALRGDKPVAKLRTGQLAGSIRVSQDAREVRRLMVHLLQGGTLPARPEGGRRGVMRSFQALRSTLALLDDDEGEEGRSALLEALGLPSSSQEFSERAFDDDEDQRALIELLQELRENPAPADAIAALRQSIHDAARQLESSERSTIFSSLNAGDAAATQANPPKFLDAYSELVHGDKPFGERFAQLLERYGPGELRTTLPAIKRALADDLDAATKSRDPIRLHAVLSEMGHMHVATTLVELVDTMTKQFNRMQSDEAPSTLDPNAMLRHLHTLLDSGWATSAQYHALAADLELPEGAPVIQMLTGLRGVLARLPTRIFQDDNVRHSTFTALQGALDQLIEKEEEGFDEAAEALDTAPRLQ